MQKITISHLPDIRWNISGFYANDLLIQVFLQVLAQAQETTNEIKSVYGSPSCPWNSGRLTDNVFNLTYLTKNIEWYNSRGIGVNLTFSNSYITEKLLKNENGNVALEAISQSAQNGVILSSDILNNYLKQKFPNIKRIASVLKVTMENGKGDLEYYKKSQAEYDMVVLHPDDIWLPGAPGELNCKFIEQLDKNKLEILVDEKCPLNCSVRKKHYELLSQRSMELCSAADVENFLAKICPDKRWQEYDNCTLSQKNIDDLYVFGLRNFKISRLRLSSHIPQRLLYALIRYIIDLKCYIPFENAVFQVFDIAKNSKSLPYPFND